MKRWAWVSLTFGLNACASLPEGLTPVAGFESERYLGRWYEVARLDHRFERGLEQVTAEYSRDADGRIHVVNRGYNVNKNKWVEAQGRAGFVGPTDVGQLQVTFFGLFRSGYNIVVLDRDYRYAMVAGDDRSYLWILSRTPGLPPKTLRRLVAQASSMGFDVGGLIRVKQRH